MEKPKTENCLGKEVKRFSPLLSHNNIPAEMLYHTNIFHQTEFTDKFLEWQFDSQ